MQDTLSYSIDSIVKDTAGAMFSEPILAENPVEPFAFKGIPGFVVHHVTEAWYFYFVIFLLVGYIVARALLGPWMQNTLNAAVRYNAASSMFKDNSQLQRQQDLVLYGLYFISGGFFLTLLANQFQLIPYQLHGMEVLGFFTLLLFALFFLRIVVTNIIGHVFFSLDLFREYLYHGFIFNKLTGIAMIPMSIIILYTTGTLNIFVVWITIGVLLVILMMKIFRGIIFSTKNRVFNFYLFLYLCALEIVPLMLLFKWFSNAV